MPPWLGNAYVQLAIWLGLLLSFATVGIFIIGKIRAKAVQQEPFSSEILAKFREAHSRGDLDDEEFRTIKGTVTRRFRAELSDDGEKG